MQKKSIVMSLTAGAIAFTLFSVHSLRAANQPKTATQIIKSAYQAAQAGPPKECQTNGPITKACTTALQYKTIETFASALLQVAPLIDDVYVRNEVVDLQLIPGNVYSVQPDDPPWQKKVPAFLVGATKPFGCQKGDIIISQQYWYSQKATGMLHPQELMWLQTVPADYADPKYQGLEYFFWGNNYPLEADFQPGDQLLSARVCAKGPNLSGYVQTPWGPKPPPSW